ncbi:hypothetical protein [Aliikangiella coralliicola]|uniref:Uncharacterized protein n=1 Tax=Aliikangiella coralliicola TaxID=2592383 RepID=A0A545UHA3_9GAMM|nr:hypothetical protein [Aliikangiella coralliicola]TQV88847.1 hypothetical protein FLL46_04755 [Aliikangiella coralliicola]
MRKNFKLASIAATLIFISSTAFAGSYVYKTSYGTTKAQAVAGLVGSGYTVSRCYSPGMGPPWACDGYKRVN